MRWDFVSVSYIGSRLDGLVTGPEITRDLPFVNMNKWWPPYHIDCTAVALLLVLPVLSSSFIYKICFVSETMSPLFIFNTIRLIDKQFIYIIMVTKLLWVFLSIILTNSECIIYLFVIRIIFSVLSLISNARNLFFIWNGIHSFATKYSPIRAREKLWPGWKSV